MSTSPPAEPQQPTTTRRLPVVSPKFWPVNVIRLDSPSRGNDVRNWSAAIRRRFSGSCQTVSVAWAIAQRADRLGWCYGTNKDLANFAGNIPETRVQDALLALEAAGAIYRANVDVGVKRGGNRYERRIWLSLALINGPPGGPAPRGSRWTRSQGVGGTRSQGVQKDNRKIGRFPKEEGTGLTSTVEPSSTSPSPAASDLDAAPRSAGRAPVGALPPKALD